MRLRSVPGLCYLLHHCEPVQHFTWLYVKVHSIRSFCLSILTAVSFHSDKRVIRRVQTPEDPMIPYGWHRRERRRNRQKSTPHINSGIWVPKMKSWWIAGEYRPTTRPIDRRVRTIGESVVNSLHKWEQNSTSNQRRICRNRFLWVAKSRETHRKPKADPLPPLPSTS